jgi:hypothetical protein
MTRTGKIAKLPPSLQEELNHRLERGVSGRVLVAWLNAHPVVQAVLREFFEGAPVNEQNLSAWRCGGFADWQTRRNFFDQVREVATDAVDFEKVAARMADHAARLLSAHYAIALAELPPPRRAVSGNSKADPGPCPYAALSAQLKPLAAITRTVTALRRGEHEDARLKLHIAQQARTLTTGSHATSVGRENQGPSSQIKVQEIPEKNPGTVPAAKLAASPERGNQGSSSQIKVPENPVTLAPISTANPAAPRPPGASKTSSTSSLTQLTLTFPPALPFFVPSPVSSQVA